MNNKEFIAFLMDIADSCEKAKQEMRGIKASGRIISKPDYEAMKEILISAIADLDIADSDINEYERFGFIGSNFAVRPRHIVE